MIFLIVVVEKILIVVYYFHIGIVINIFFAE